MQDIKNATDSAAREPAPHRETIEALINSLDDPGAPYPLWVQVPLSEAEFAASIYVHDRDIFHWGVELVYDAADRLIAYKGIRMRERAARARTRFR
jgi:hypothetical protein